MTFELYGDWDIIKTMKVKDSQSQTKDVMTINLSNVIAQMITDMLEDKSEIEIQRNILAQNVGCVPSQINYVLSSRFTPERGYIVESKRGGGGCIRITRVSYDENTLLLQVIKSIGGTLDAATAEGHIVNLLRHRLINQRDAALILSAMSESNYKELPTETRDHIRAGIFKQMLLAIMQ